MMVAIFKYIQDIPSKSNRIHIIFKCTGKIFHDRPQVGPQKNLNTCKKIEIISRFSLTLQMYEIKIQLQEEN